MHAIPKDGARVLHASQKLCSTHWFDVNRGVGYCVDTREAEFSLHLLDSKLSGVADRAFMDLVVGFHLEESFVEESALDGDLAGDNSVYFDLTLRDKLVDFSRGSESLECALVPFNGLSCDKETGQVLKGGITTESTWPRKKLMGFKLTTGRNPRAFKTWWQNVESKLRSKGVNLAARG